MVTKKTGIDDYLVLKGEQAVLKVIDNAKEYNPFAIAKTLGDLAENDRALEINNLIPYIHVFNKLDIIKKSMLEKLIMKDGNLDKKTLNLKFAGFNSGIKKKSTKLTGNVSSDTVKEIEYTVPVEGIFSFFQNITKALNGTEEVYRIDKSLWQINIESSTKIATPASLAGLLADFCSFHKYTEKDGLVYFDPPKDLLNTYLHSYKQNRQFKEIICFSKMPLYDVEYNLCLPGYNELSKVYYQGKEIEPVPDGNLNIKRLLSGFCFEKASDLAN